MTWLDLIIGVGTAWSLGSAIFEMVHATILNMHDKPAGRELKIAAMWSALFLILCVLQVRT